MRASKTHSPWGRKGFDPQYRAGLADAYRAILSLVPVAGETVGRATPLRHANSLKSFDFPGLDG
jgi:hypothetical protein